MIHVVAGVVYDAVGRVLIAQRLPGKHLAGGWEFPGGKLEPQEVGIVGLARELREELGISVRTPRPLLRLMHAYPHGQVLLEVWVVRHYAGVPDGLDGQALRWCEQSELEATELLPADAPVVAALRLPEVLTDLQSQFYRTVPFKERDAPATVLKGVRCATASEGRIASNCGAKFLVMTEALADAEVRALCAAVPLPVFIRTSSLEHAWMLGASGIHAPL